MDWRYRNMRINITSRSIYALRAGGVLFVVLAVFGWGLQYKMSLYDPPSSPSTALPHAKLLSQKERPISSPGVSSIRPGFPQQRSSIFFLAGVLAAILTGLSTAASRWMRTRSTIRNTRRRPIAASNFFSFRPPPVQNPSN